MTKKLITRKKKPATPVLGGRPFAGLSASEAAVFLHNAFAENPDTAHLAEAFTQADIELALDDRGWLVGGKRMAGELDPLSRQVQVNRSRYYWLRDPLVKQAVRLYTDYAFGAEYMSWHAMDEENQPDEETQGKLDKFMKNRANRRITSRAGQRRMSQRLLVDGELFFAFYEDGNVRMFDCLQMTDIVTDPDDEDVVVAYKRVTNARSTNPKTLYYKPWDYNEDKYGPTPKVGASEIQPYYGGDSKPVEDIKFEDKCVMYHLAFDAFEKRGTTLISACSDWTREHRRFMTARVAIAEALSRFSFKGKIKGGQKIINSVRAKLESTFSQTGLSGGTEHQPPNAPGGIWLENEGLNLEALPRMTGASDAKADSEQLKLQVCAGTGIMLHYFGDPSTGNLATATAMELPMLKMFAAYQQLWKDAWRDMFSIVLEEEPDDEQANIVIVAPDIIDQDLQAQSQYLTSITTAFPEAKVPSVLRRFLSILGMENLDELMDEIADQKEENDQKQADMLAQGVMTDKNGKPVAPKGNGTPASGGSAGPNPDANEAALLTKLIEVLS